MDKNTSNRPQRVVEMNRSSSSDAVESASVATWVSDVPVTKERKPFRLSRNEKQLPDPGEFFCLNILNEWFSFLLAGCTNYNLTGTARVNVAPSRESPRGTTANDWAARHSHQTVFNEPTAA